MQFQRVLNLADDTPAHTLREAWGVDLSEVSLLAQGKRAMTVRQVGALAEIHGMKLLDLVTS